ncbi:MAG: ATP synthase F0 subunit B [Spirochaetes bacterium]|nr:MAG: ATP synthase F0 subunit B [Spirochaetota bacterium]
MELFEIEPGLAIWTWLSFGLLFFILWKFLLPSLLKSIKDREKTIAGAVDNAEEIQKRLDEIKKEESKIIDKARAQADKILGDTRKEADVLKSRLIAKAEEEAEAIVSRAKLKAAEEREVLLQALQEELADFVCEASEKVTGVSFTSEKDRRMVKEMARTL